MQVGDSSGYANSGYQSTYDSVNIVGNLGAQSSTTFYGLADDTTIGNDYNITIELVNVYGNSWSISHQGGDSDDKVLHGGGSITLSNALDRLKIKTQNGRYLDNGIVTVHYETEGSGSSSSSSGGGSSEPVGAIIAWAGSATQIPNDYKLCDGSSLSRTDFADLFAALGTTYGTGDGSTTFNIPDLRNKFIVGAGGGYNPGNTGGSADAVVVSHTHTVCNETGLGPQWAGIF